MNNEERNALAGRLERLAALTAGRLEEQLTGAETESRRGRETLGMLKDLLALARELRTDEARDVVVRFVDGAEQGSV